MFCTGMRFIHLNHLTILKPFWDGYPSDIPGNQRGKPQNKGLWKMIVLMKMDLSVFIVGSCVQCFGEEQPNWISNPLDLALSFFSTNMSEEPPTCLFYPSKNDLQPPNIQISSRKFVCTTTKYDLSWFHQPKTMDVACLLPKLSQNDQNGWVDTSTPTGRTCLLLILLGYVTPRTRPIPVCCHHPTWFPTQKMCQSQVASSHV